jgi:DNA adenine methylase
VDHETLFALLAKASGAVTLMYDDSQPVRALAKRHGFLFDMVPMKNTHHALLYELIITNGKGRIHPKLAPKALFRQYA